MDNNARTCNIGPLNHCKRPHPLLIRDGYPQLPWQVLQRVLLGPSGRYHDLLTPQSIPNTPYSVIREQLNMIGTKGIATQVRGGRQLSRQNGHHPFLRSYDRHSLRPSRTDCTRSYPLLTVAKRVPRLINLSGYVHIRRPTGANIYIKPC